MRKRDPKGDTTQAILLSTVNQKFFFGNFIKLRRGFKLTFLARSLIDWENLFEILFQQEKRKSAKLSQRTTDRLLFGDASDSEDELIEVSSANKKLDKKSSERPPTNQKPASDSRTNEKDDRTSAAFRRAMTYGQLNAEKKAEKQKSRSRNRFRSKLSWRLKLSIFLKW